MALNSFLGCSRTLPKPVGLAKTLDNSGKSTFNRCFLTASCSHHRRVRQPLLGWHRPPPFLCGLAHLTAKFIRNSGRQAGSVHFANRFGEFFWIAGSADPVCQRCMGRGRPLSHPGRLRAGFSLLPSPVAVHPGIVFDPGRFCSAGNNPAGRIASVDPKVF